MNDPEICKFSKKEDAALGNFNIDDDAEDDEEGSVLDDDVQQDVDQ